MRAGLRDKNVTNWPETFSLRLSVRARNPASMNRSNNIWQSIEREGSKWLLVTYRGEWVQMEEVCEIEEYRAKDETHTLYRSKDGRYFLRKEQWNCDGCDEVSVKISGVSFKPVSERAAMAWFIKDRLDYDTQFRRLFIRAISA